jgi:hypothetical protein
MEELETCYDCGSEPIVEESYLLWRVYCMSCENSTEMYATKEEAVDAWQSGNRQYRR